MIIKVTQEHIDKAPSSIANSVLLYSHSCNCPVALALKDTFKVNYTLANYENLKVGKFPEDNIIFETVTPKEVVDWMNHYDINMYAEAPQLSEPFEFELSLEGVKL